jgi:glycosyltransferase involved in cell wall biosynthesis
VAGVRVVVLTTSYPRNPDDVAGAFVRDAVDAARGEGVDVVVVSPASFRHFGLAFGDGVLRNLRRRPWLVFALPLFLGSFVRSARRASRDADLVHAHWLPLALVALLTRRPYVVQPWGSDVELARRAPHVFRPLLRRAQLVIAASSSLQNAAYALGARDVRIVPSGVRAPDSVAPPSNPAHVLYVGRLSPEKGIEDFVAATQGIPRVIVGAGPIDIPEAVGFVPPAELWRSYERATVICVPSRREGYGVVAREAMAYGRPVVVTAVGGLLDAVEHERTGLVVPPRDVPALRAAIVRLLDDRELRERLGLAAREEARKKFSREQEGTLLAEAYRDAIGMRSYSAAG